MLEYLRIRDLALIEDMELDFTSGMNVLTGETGAGKTFILKAIQFLLGEKLHSEMVRSGAEKAQVEAIFRTGDEEHMLRRELLAETGRSRFFYNGNVSSQEVMKELRPNLILHVGQHGQQRLLQASFQAQLVDDFMEDKNIIAEKEDAHKHLKKIITEKTLLLTKIESLEDKRELLELQQREIEKVDPEAGEEERLDALRLQYKSLDYIQKAYEEGLTILLGSDGSGLLVMLQQFAKVLEIVDKNDDINLDVSNAKDSLLNFEEEAKELASRFRSTPSVDIEDNLTLNDIEARLYKLATLKRKLNRSFDGILSLRDEVSENLSFLDACTLDIRRMEKDEEHATHALIQTLKTLNAAREKTAYIFCSALVEELQGLGFSEKVQVIPELVPHEIKKATSTLPSCIENTVRFLWAPNPGQAPQPLDKIASGGELSRFLLAVIGLQQTRTHATEDITLIFDEVDSGVGGITLNRVADRLTALAQKKQMLLITHWPQLAAKGKSHFFISKEFTDNETFTRCVRLDAAAREQELARMAGQE